MEKKIIRLTESYLHRIITEAVNDILTEGEEGPYWYCEFEDKEGKITSKIIWGRTTVEAFKSTAETGVKYGLEPMYETLRPAEPKEIAAFKRMIKNRAKKNSRI